MRRPEHGYEKKITRETEALLIAVQKTRQWNQLYKSGKSVIHK